jgi:hypothetical protein
MTKLATLSLICTSKPEGGQLQFLKILWLRSFHKCHAVIKAREVWSRLVLLFLNFTIFLHQPGMVVDLLGNGRCVKFKPCQISFAKEQSRIRWFAVSVSWSHRTHFSSWGHPLASSLSAVHSLFWTNNQKKIKSCLHLGHPKPSQPWFLDSVKIRSEGPLAEFH